MAVDGFDEHCPMAGSGSPQGSPILSVSCMPSPIPYLQDDEAFEGAPEQLEDKPWIYDMVPHPDDSNLDLVSSQAADSHALSPIPPTSPFPVFASWPSSFKGFHTAHEKWWIRAILMLVALLHMKHHVSFRACGLILGCLCYIFILMAFIPANDAMPMTLTTAFTHLSITDRFSIFVSCPICSTPVSMDLMPVTKAASICQSCGNDLYNGLSADFFEISWEAHKRLKKCPTPKVVVPMVPLSTLISDFLMCEGMEREVESWHNGSSTPGVYTCVMDGTIWQSILGRDGEQFFAPGEDDKLQIGVTSSLDWFQAQQGDYSPSHSLGVFLFTVANLVTELKYRTENLLLATMTPGPHEPTAEDLQNHLKFIVDDLLLLYDEGIIVKTPMFPFACLTFICDHPAAVKMSGCADTGHLVSPCTHCSVTQADIFSDKSLKNGFPQCDNAEHVRRAWEWIRLGSAKERDTYFKEHGTRWF
ncbi:hypothetical protein K439DRAFT_1622144 [Ramaria rubella]|nr:hypothetical protein K439DRAFT_1622144 [Ramaria rubella]